MRARATWIAVVLSGCSLLVNPRAENEYDLSDGGGQARDGGDGGRDRDGGVDAGPPIPATPSLRFPWNGFMTGSAHTGGLPPERNALRPRFVWEPTEGAERYEVQLTAACEAQAREACTFDGAIEGVSTESEWRPEEALPVSLTAPVGRRYVWRARACNVAGCSAWSPVRYLDVGRQPSDFNGDGYADVLVGAPFEAGGAGRAYVFEGPGLTFDDELSNPRGADSGGSFGNVVGHAGDLTADGFADLVVGSDTDDLDGLSNAGRAWFCPWSGFRPDCLPVTDTEIISPDPQLLGRFASAIAGGCDVDGNGYGDFFVGAYSEDAGGVGDAGRVYAYFMPGDGTVPAPVVVESPMPNERGHFGVSIDCSSDLDGDGFVDVLVGAEGENGGGVSESGRVYVYPGGADGLGPEPSEVLLNPNGVAGGLYGRSVMASDLFGDGIPDVIVASPCEAIGGFRCVGRVYVHRRARSGTETLTIEPSIPSQNLAFGLRVATIDARTGAGALLVATPLDGPGQVFVYRAEADGTLDGPTAVEAAGLASDAGFGFALSVVGDVAGDGTVLLGIGAPMDTDTMGRAQAGSARTYQWSADGVLNARGRLESATGTVSGGFGMVGGTSSNMFEL